MNRPRVVYFPSDQLVYFPSGVRTSIIRVVDEKIARQPTSKTMYEASSPQMDGLIAQTQS
jgi:hypothetical protein